MERHCENARPWRVFETHPDVEWVRYPGLEDDPEYEKNRKYLRGKGGGMVVFEIKGGREAGAKFIEGLALFSIWRMSATPSRWRFTRPRPPTRS